LVYLSPHNEYQRRRYWQKSRKEKVVKIVTLDERALEPISLEQSYLRSILAFGFATLCCVPAIFDVMAALFSEEIQTWHDKFAKTVVVEQ
jgi:uncharacterized RDD family membrane protein YckC